MKSFSYSANEWLKQLIYREVTDQEKISFSHHLGLMLKAGVPIMEAVDILQTETASQKFKKIIQQLVAELEKGKPLSSLLTKEKFFSPSHLAILKSGETSGKIVESFKRITNDLKRDYQIKKKIKGAMSYPAIICLTLIGISTFIVMFVLPKVGDVFKQMNVPIPLATRIFLMAGDFLNHNYLFLIGLLIGFIFLFIFLFQFSDFGRRLMGIIFSSLPIIKKIIYEMNMARFIRSLSSLLISGVPLTEALNSAGEVFIGEKSQKMVIDIREQVRNGVSLAQAFRLHEQYFGSILVKMCSVGERSGNLAEILADLAASYEEEVQSKLENFSTIIEPLLMLLVGLGVGAMVLAIIGPIYQMISKLTG